MNRFVKEFLRRGMLFAWGGPAVVAIVWLILGKTGQLEALRTGEAVLGVLSSTVLAFVAAGITAVYQLEQLPKPMAGLIHLAVLYAVYLLNGWIEPRIIAAFTLVFAAGFLFIWAAVYLTVSRSVKKMNRFVGKKD